MTLKSGKRIYSLLMFLLVFFSCESNLEKAIKESKRLNNLITQQKMPNYDSVYNAIYSLKKIPVPELKLADTLYSHTVTFDHLVDSLIQILETKDPDGSDEKVAQSLLLGSPTGNKLINLINHIYSESIKSFSRETEVQGFEKRFERFHKWLKRGAFADFFFSQKPTASVVLVLRSVRLDLIRASAEGLYDINSRNL